MIYLSEKPSFINRWAKQFVSIYRGQGKDPAMAWAMEFLPREAVGPVANRAKQLLGKI